MWAEGASGYYSQIVWQRRQRASEIHPRSSRTQSSPEVEGTLTLKLQLPCRTTFQSLYTKGGDICPKSCEYLDLCDRKGTTAADELVLLHRAGRAEYRSGNFYLDRRLRFCRPVC